MTPGGTRNSSETAGTINLMESAREALTEAEMFGSVPDEIATLLKSSAISDLECGPGA